jgi:hypothetical protein
MTVSVGAKFFAQVVVPPHGAGWALHASFSAVAQSSGAGSTSPVHAPKPLPSGLHVCTPALHAPTPSVAAGPS